MWKATIQDDPLYVSPLPKKRRYNKYRSIALMEEEVDRLYSHLLGLEDLPEDLKHKILNKIRRIFVLRVKEREKEKKLIAWHKKHNQPIWW